MDKMDKTIVELITKLEDTQHMDGSASSSVVDSLILVDPENRLDRLDRIHFLLEKIKLEQKRGSLARSIIETIIADINILCSMSDLSKIKEMEAKKNSNKKNQSAGGLIELCYMSEAVEPFSEKELMLLRAQARANNAKKDISGFFAYDHTTRNFFQILEGPEKAVHLLMNKIQQDTRHHKIQVRFVDQIECRGYADWSMSLVTLSELRASIAHVEELNEWLCNELFIDKDLPCSKGRKWVNEQLRLAYLENCLEEVSTARLV